MRDSLERADHRVERSGRSRGEPLDRSWFGLRLPEINDEFMHERLAKSQSYTLLMLGKTAAFARPDVDPIVWEHGRRNFRLREAGQMPVICPVRDASEWACIAILTVAPDRAAEILSEDPGVNAGIFSFEVHPVAGFPGSSLPDVDRPDA